MLQLSLVTANSLGNYTKIDPGYFKDLLYTGTVEEIQQKPGGGGQSSGGRDGTLEVRVEVGGGVLGIIDPGWGIFGTIVQLGTYVVHNFPFATICIITRVLASSDWRIIQSLYEDKENTFPSLVLIINPIYHLTWKGFYLMQSQYCCIHLTSLHISGMTL